MTIGKSFIRVTQKLRFNGLRYKKVLFYVVMVFLGFVLYLILSLCL